MNKLIKLSDTHYIVVDDSEITEGDWYLDDTKKIRQSITSDEDYWSVRHDYKKITHSTQPLSDVKFTNFFDKIKPLSLSEVEEVIYGYSVEKVQKAKFLEFRAMITEIPEKNLFEIGVREGFKAHQELVKDKLFTVDDMRKAIELTLTLVGNHWSDIKFEIDKDKFKSIRSSINNHIQSLLPKTEWDIEFVEGKLKLL